MLKSCQFLACLYRYAGIVISKIALDVNRALSTDILNFNRRYLLQL